MVSSPGAPSDSRAAARFSRPQPEALSVVSDTGGAAVIGELTISVKPEGGPAAGPCRQTPVVALTDPPRTAWVGGRSSPPMAAHWESCGSSGTEARTIQRRAALDAAKSKPSGRRDTPLWSRTGGSGPAPGLSSRIKTPGTGFNLITTAHKTGRPRRQSEAEVRAARGG